jgi:hypothetical protein
VDVKQRILGIISAAALALLAGCGGSTFNTHNPPPPTQSNVTIAYQTAPPTTVVVGSTTGIQFTPTVTNDPNNLGVDWALTCSNTFGIQAPCGVLNISSMHSASGATVTYTPPVGFPTANLTVNVTAFATADHTKNVTTPVTVTSYSTVLAAGNYVFQVKGSDINALPYQVTGVITLDGNGNVTAGEQILNSISNFSSLYTLQGSSAPSTYFIGPDGRGSITMNVEQVSNTSNIFTQSFSLVVISGTEAMIAELDNNSSAGTFELQDASAAGTLPAGAFAFASSGTDNLGAPLAFGGVLNIGGSGAISGVGSLADQQYEGKLISCSATNVISGSVSQPDSFGFVTISLATNQSTQSPCLEPNGSVGIFVPTAVSGFIVDATHIRLIETDDISGSGGALTAGLAIGQGSSAGTFTNASFSGPYVWGVIGESLLQVPSSMTSAGTASADGLGDISGVTDTLANPSGGGNPAQVLNAQFTGAYTTDPQQIGRVAWNVSFPHNVSFKPIFVSYLTGPPGSPALVLLGGALGSVGVGTIYPQASPASSLSLGNPQTYGLSITQQNGSENDGTGQMTTHENPQPPPQWEITGTVDDFNNNEFTAPGTPVSLLDSFQPPTDSFGRIAGTFMYTPSNPNTGYPSGYVNYYLIDNSHGFIVETDLVRSPPASTNPGSGQIMLGYYATSCDVTSSTSCQQGGAAAGRHSLSKGRVRKDSRKNHDATSSLKDRMF